MTHTSTATDPFGGVTAPDAVSPVPALGPALKTGLLGAVLPSLCCVIPALIMSAGLGALSGLVQMSVLQPYAIGLSVLLMGALNWRTIRRQRACCAGPRQRLALYLTPAVSLAVFAAVYGGLLYVVVPLLYGAMPDMPGT